MSKATQLTIAVQNQPGAVARIARALANAKVNILCLLGTTQGTGGTLRLLAEDSGQAKKALDDAKITYQEASAEVSELSNKPGALAEYLEKLAAQGISLGAICATVSKGGKSATVFSTIEARAQAAKALAVAAQHP